MSGKHKTKGSRRKTQRSDYITERIPNVAQGQVDKEKN
jgi:hypothetical protein